MDHPEDLDLFLQIREKDSQTSFKFLFKKYYVVLCRFAMQIVKEEEAAEEVVQETFVHFWENRKVIMITSSLSGYLYSSVRNAALNHLQKTKVRLKHESIFATTSDDDIPETEDIRLKAIVNEAIQLLPEKCKEIFCMARFEGLTHEEIADYLRISKKTIENQMTIAFQKIREYMKDHVPDKQIRKKIMLLLMV